MRKDQVEDLVCYGSVGCCPETFVQGEDLAKLTYVFVLAITVAFHCHFEHLAEEVGQVEVFLEPGPEILQYVALLQPLKDAHHVVENRRKRILRR